jgi:hypothetical protein
MDHGEIVIVRPYGGKPDFRAVFVEWLPGAGRARVRDGNGNEYIVDAIQIGKTCQPKGQ